MPSMPGAKAGTSSGYERNLIRVIRCEAEDDGDDPIKATIALCEHHKFQTLEALIKKVWKDAKPNGPSFDGMADGFNLHQAAADLESIQTT